jgi:hypothetical protein
MRRRAVGEQLFAAAKHDRHREEAHGVDQVIGEQRVDELGTALGDEVPTSNPSHPLRATTHNPRPSSAAPAKRGCTVDQILKMKESGLSEEQIKAECGSDQ